MSANLVPKLGLPALRFPTLGFLGLGSLAMGLGGCTASHTPGTAHDAEQGRAPMGLVREGTPAAVDIAKARARNATRQVQWIPFGPSAFERAKREEKLVLLDGSAEWCHWCHVMDETTYSDPAVGKLLRERFITVRIDVDSRPDLAERYGEWGWPATIVLDASAEEVGKFRGYLPPAELDGILRDALRGKAAAVESAREPGAPLDALPWILRRTERDLDGYYDEKLGGWGMRQKAPIGANIELDLLRSAQGDTQALERAKKSLVAQRALIDRVWGGMYQYSAGGGWDEPHYEKLMSIQAASLEAYARGYAATRDPSFLADARDIERYVTTILSQKEGGFYATQDADVNAHDPKAPFIDGRVFYEKSDAERKALGSPRVDTHVYALENGRAIAALVTFYDASHDAAALDRAKQAADRMLASHVTREGLVKHDAESSGESVYLADTASLGLGLARLARVTNDPRYRDAAVRIATAMDRSFGGAPDGALYASSSDPHSTGVFARRRQPFDANVAAARFLAELGRSTGDPSFRERGRKIAAAIATPSALADQGRLVGEYLLALEELGID